MLELPEDVNPVQAGDTIDNTMHPPILAGDIYCEHVDGLHEGTECAEGELCDAGKRCLQNYGESTHLQGFTIAAITPTALKEMATGKAISSVNYFNLAGQQMTEPASGVTIVVTTYSDGSRSTSKVVR